MFVLLLLLLVFYCSLRRGVGVGVRLGEWGVVRVREPMIVGTAGAFRGEGKGG